jgi:hypothetical protein
MRHKKQLCAQKQEDKMHTKYEEEEHEKINRDSIYFGFVRRMW